MYNPSIVKEESDSRSGSPSNVMNPDKLRQVDFRWAVSKGFLDRETKKWNDAKGGLEQYLKERNQRMLARCSKNRRIRKNQGSSKFAPGLATPLLDDAGAILCKNSRYSGADTLNINFGKQIESAGPLLHVAAKAAFTNHAELSEFQFKQPAGHRSSKSPFCSDLRSSMFDVASTSQSSPFFANGEHQLLQKSMHASQQSADVFGLGCSTAPHLPATADHAYQSQLLLQNLLASNTAAQQALQAQQDLDNLVLQSLLMQARAPAQASHCAAPAFNMNGFHQSAHQAALPAASRFDDLAKPGDFLSRSLLQTTLAAEAPALQQLQLLRCLRESSPTQYPAQYPTLPPLMASATARPQGFEAGLEAYVQALGMLGVQAA